MDKINPLVFIASALSALLTGCFTILYPHMSALVFDYLQNLISLNLSWYYMLVVVIALIFVIWLALSPYGNIKLGAPNDKPDFSYGAWSAMLFSAGIGIALLYYGAYEPVEHFLQPPQDGGTASLNAQHAMVLTFFHWGIHGWALYGLMAVIIAYYHYVEKLPLSLRSALFPLFKHKITGWRGDIIDILGILATIVAMVSNLGIGALLVEAGIGNIFHVSANKTAFVIIIIAMSAMAGFVAIFSIEKGLSYLSKINIFLLFLLLSFVFFFSNKAHILDGFVQNIGDYLNNFIKLSFDLYIYQNNVAWRGLWTVFFWAWWIAWAPFVSLFIARISKGRTIREVLLGVLFIPLIFTLLWLAVFGNGALDLIINAGHKELGEKIIAQGPNAIFEFLTYYPQSNLSFILTTIISAVLCFAPIDSGCIMIANLSRANFAKTKGNFADSASLSESDAPIILRLFWCAVTCFITIGLFLADNFLAMQTAVVLCGLPFSLVLLLYMVSFKKSLSSHAFKH